MDVVNLITEWGAELKIDPAALQSSARLRRWVRENPRDARRVADVLEIVLDLLNRLLPGPGDPAA